jgi:hypothetical protein
MTWKRNEAVDVEVVWDMGRGEMDPIVEVWTRRVSLAQMVYTASGPEAYARN